MIKPQTTMGRLVLLACWAALALAGCATPSSGVLPGNSSEAVLARMGPPTARYPLAQGERLQYSAQPFGGSVYNVDLDAAGKVVSVQQVLDEALYGAIQPDAWTQADVLRQFGRPALVSRVGNFNGPVWSYRYVSRDGAMRMLHVFIDPAGTVRRYQMTDEQFREPSD